MSYDFVFTLIGSFISVCLIINGFLLKTILGEITTIKISLAVIETKQENNKDDISSVNRRMDTFFKKDLNLNRERGLDS